MIKRPPVRIDNYYKVVGPFLGRPEHCFTFASRDEIGRIKAAARATVLAQKTDGARVAVYLPVAGSNAPASVIGEGIGRWDR